MHMCKFLSHFLSPTQSVNLSIKRHTGPQSKATAGAQRRGKAGVTERARFAIFTKYVDGKIRTKTSYKKYEKKYDKEKTIHHHSNAPYGRTK